jgi:hypothetical protein
MTRFWNNLHQVCSKSKDWKVKGLYVKLRFICYTDFDNYGGKKRNYVVVIDISLTATLTTVQKTKINDIDKS